MSNVLAEFDEGAQLEYLADTGQSPTTAADKAKQAADLMNQMVGQATSALQQAQAAAGAISDPGVQGGVLTLVKTALMVTTRQGQLIGDVLSGKLDYQKWQDTLQLAVNDATAAWEAAGKSGSLGDFGYASVDNRWPAAIRAGENLGYAAVDNQWPAAIKYAGLGYASVDNGWAAAIRAGENLGAVELGADQSVGVWQTILNALHGVLGFISDTGKTVGGLIGDILGGAGAGVAKVVTTPLLLVGGIGLGALFLLSRIKGEGYGLKLGDDFGSVGSHRRRRRKSRKAKSSAKYGWLVAVAAGGAFLAMRKPSAASQAASAAAMQAGAAGAT